MKCHVKNNNIIVTSSKLKKFKGVANDTEQHFNLWLQASNLYETEFYQFFEGVSFYAKVINYIDGIAVYVCAADREIGLPFTYTTGADKGNFKTDCCLMLTHICTRLNNCYETVKYSNDSLNALHEIMKI